MSSIDLASPEKSEIRRIFDSIAFRYDFINSFLSFRLDELWRKKACRLVLDGTEKSILDIGVGTGKFLEVFLKAQNWEEAWGLDFSSGMLEEAGRHLPRGVKLVAADFHDLPFPDERFDVIISAFTLRSVKDLKRHLAETFRVLRPGGKVAFLCLTRPVNFLTRALYSVYLKVYLPLMGQIISGDRNAYRFLSSSIQTFQDPAETMNRMQSTGYGDVCSRRFTLGAATLISGRKPEERNGKSA